MPFGVTPDGFLRKPVDKIRDSIFSYLRTKISKHLKLNDRTGLGTIAESAIKELDALWELAEKAYLSNDPDNADEAAFVAVCEITGTKRRGATKGRVLCTCVFDGSRTYAPGDLIAHVAGKPDNRWVNRDEIVTVSPGYYTNIVFEAETAGSASSCNAGTLTTVAQTATGWSSISNPAEATPGTDIESIESLATRREQELQISDAGPLPAIRGKVSKVPGVLQVKAQENKTDHWGLLPPHSYRIIVWDGPGLAALDDDIAQAIVDSGCAGISSLGASSGNAVDADGNAATIKFDRATAVPIYVAITVNGTATEAAIAQAIVDKGGTLGVGDDVIVDKLKAAAVMLDTVVDCPSFTLGTDPSPVGTDDIVIAVDQIATFDVARVDVTVVP